MYKKTIELFLLDGTPDGRIICNVSNWDGIGLKIPKTKIKGSNDREELKNTGLYLLFNKNETSGSVYIGEAENVYERLIQHLSKDNWNECLVFVKKENGLNKAHIKFLENYFYNLAKEADRYDIENNSIPTRSSISEAEIAAMEEFSYYIKLITNTLGYKAFEKLLEEDVNKNEMLFINSKNLKASGKLTNEGFVVLKGSESSKVFKAASSILFNKKWQNLRDEKIVNENGVFLKDYLFTSPSLAGAMILGRNSNGLTEWKNSKKEILKSLLNNDFKVN